jgi:predicted enzyme related to lactoylglutathione lyase
MGKPVLHWEFWSKSPKEITAWYSKVFDWKAEERPDLNYTIVDTGSKEGINGGITKPDKPQPWPGNMCFYVVVDDLVAYRKRVKDAGGKIMIEEQEVPGMGSFSLFADPEGRVNGIFKPSANMAGHD